MQEKDFISIHPNFPENNMSYGVNKSSFNSKAYICTLSQFLNFATYSCLLFGNKNIVIISFNIFMTAKRIEKTMFASFGKQLIF